MVAVMVLRIVRRMISTIRSLREILESGANVLATSLVLILFLGGMGFLCLFSSGVLG
jgi:hypothetical protein